MNASSRTGASASVVVPQPFTHWAYMPISAGDLATVATLSPRGLPPQQAHRPSRLQPSDAREADVQAQEAEPWCQPEGPGAQGLRLELRLVQGEAARTFNKRDSVDQATYEWYTGVDRLYLPWDQLFAAGVYVDPDPGLQRQAGADGQREAVVTNMISEQMEILDLGFRRS